jgi:hypothetical protein
MDFSEQFHDDRLQFDDRFKRYCVINFLWKASLIVCD